MNAKNNTNAPRPGAMREEILRASNGDEIVHITSSPPSASGPLPTLSIDADILRDIDGNLRLGLLEAFTTASHVLHGFSQEPRFSHGGRFNAAGEILDDAVSFFDRAKEFISELPCSTDDPWSFEQAAWAQLQGQSGLGFDLANFAALASRLAAEHKALAREERAKLVARGRAA